MTSSDEYLADWRRELPDLDPRFLEALLETDRLAAVRAEFLERVFEPFEIEPGEYALLAVLRRAGAPYRSSPGALAARLDLSSGGVSKRIQKLESEGWVERTRDPEDGRGAFVSLSRRGRELQERVFRALLVALESRLGRIQESRLREIAGALRELSEALEG
jgi:DNA-binding MarR family transcriptional regulator